MFFFYLFPTDIGCTGTNLLNLLTQIFFFMKQSHQGTDTLHSDISFILVNQSVSLNFQANKILTDT